MSDAESGACVFPHCIHAEQSLEFEFKYGEDLMGDENDQKYVEGLTELEKEMVGDFTKFSPSDDKGIHAPLRNA
jgi:hypothetical protein